MDLFGYAVNRWNVERANEHAMNIAGAYRKKSLCQVGSIPSSLTVIPSALQTYS